MTTRKSLSIKRKTARRAKKRAKPGKPSRHGLSVTARRVAAAIQRFEKAYRMAHARADDLAALANKIGEVAAAKQSAELVREWVDRQFLRDVFALREAFAKYPGGMLPPGIEVLRLLPDALLQWIEQRFSIQPIGSPGEVKEIPAKALAKYDHNFDEPVETTSLVKVQIVAPGWKQGTHVLIPPKIDIAPP